MTRTTSVLAGALTGGMLALATPAFSQANGGMSLQDTFDYLKTTINITGAVAWEGFPHDSLNGQDWTYTRRVALSNIRYDLPGCTFWFHYNVVTNGAVSSDVDGGVPFRDVREIKVSTEATLVTKRDAQAGHPTYSTRSQPEIYDVVASRADGTENVFSFYDMDTANRFAKAAMHAAELCGNTPISDF